MITVSRTVRTDTSIDKVWPYLADFGNAEQWDPGTVKCTRKDTAPLGKGAKWENLSKFRGRETTLEYTITTFDEPNHLALVGENKTVTSQDDMTLATVTGGGTELAYTARFTFKGLARLAGPFVKGALNKLADDTQQSLQTHLDAL